MHTGIVSIYVPPHGFVIAADGMRRDATSKVITLTAQKIFPLVTDEATLAYAWAGTTNLLREQGPINLMEQSARIGLTLTANTWHEYAAQFADAVYDKIRDVPILLKDAKEARVLFVGYFRGQPVRAQIFFNCSQGFFQRPRLGELLEAGLVPQDFCIFSGSPTVWYQQLQPVVSAPDSLREAESQAGQYLRLCIEKQDQLEECRDIGGNVHIAAVTPQGFHWLVQSQG